ncbi:IclR family transcriptional regulator domain-containing protein [Paeniglutamicibacter cryotolerans]|uniref:IclR family pca regulon transcriptional regulator n=1 Tax=Paeniglutamicibacter cryotolerans TaxID=670079 RepID=A0A839QUY5_9MICC|nr:IclR family transcriptional regulator C-terminal domain-containing protein [Paeniglutamicibacter cryotolerans]MBB2995811.1 IclR family pca regulon transcriptional regulator [Paeniglutamicibacter cryotolerans]
MAEDLPDYFVKSAEKTLSVLLAFTPERPSLTVTQAATAVGVTRASARRFLLTLADLGYLRVQGNSFVQTPRVLDLGASYLSGLSLTKVAAPHLRDLALRLDETTTLSTLDGQDVLYVARVPAPRLQSVTVNIGNRLPAWATSMGRVLLAELPDAVLEERLEHTRLHSFTAKTVTSIEQLRSELNRVREQGWSLVAQELDEGLRGVAVPVRRGIEVLGALNVSVQAHRSDQATIHEEIIPQMLLAAQAIADDFGGRLDAGR